MATEEAATAAKDALCKVYKQYPWSQYVRSIGVSTTILELKRLTGGEDRIDPEGWCITIYPHDGTPLDAPIPKEHEGVPIFVQHRGSFIPP